MWSDYKSAIKKKVAAQNQEMKSTGGGPNKKIVLTPLEEEIADLMNVRSSVSGLPTTSCFGAPRVLENSSMELEEQTLNAEEAVFHKDRNNNLFEPLNHELPTTPQEENRGRKRRFTENEERVDCVKGKTVKLVEEQTEMQKKFHEDLIHLVEAASASVKEIRRTLDKIYKEKKTQTVIMEAQLKETMRHNKEMEKIALNKTNAERKNFGTPAEKCSKGT